MRGLQRYALPVAVFFITITASGCAGPSEQKKEIGTVKAVENTPVVKIVPQPQIMDKKPAKSETLKAAERVRSVLTLVRKELRQEGIEIPLDVLDTQHGKTTADPVGDYVKDIQREENSEPGQFTDLADGDPLLEVVELLSKPLAFGDKE